MCVCVCEQYIYILPLNTSITHWLCKSSNPTEIPLIVTSWGCEIRPRHLTCNPPRRRWAERRRAQLSVGDLAPRVQVQIPIQNREEAVTKRFYGHWCLRGRDQTTFQSEIQTRQSRVQLRPFSFILKGKLWHSELWIVSSIFSAGGHQGWSMEGSKTFPNVKTF